MQMMAHLAGRGTAMKDRMRYGRVVWTVVQQSYTGRRGRIRALGVYCATLEPRVPTSVCETRQDTGSWVAGSALARYPCKLTDVLVMSHCQSAMKMDSLFAPPKWRVQTTLKHSLNISSAPYVVQPRLLWPSDPKTAGNARVADHDRTALIPLYYSCTAVPCAVLIYAGSVR